MEKDNHKKQSIVMTFKKRRYDGGTEIQLIQAIERKNQQQFAEVKARQLRVELEEQMNTNHGGTTAMQGLQGIEGMPHGYRSVNRKAPRTEDTNEPTIKAASTDGNQLPSNSTKSRRIFHAMVMGPLEIIVGCVGVVTSILAMLTFVYFKNTTLLQQSKSVFNDCIHTLKKGCVDTMFSPARVIRAAVAS